jgi:hypothetical protein
MGKFCKNCDFLLLNDWELRVLLCRFCEQIVKSPSRKISREDLMNTLLNGRTQTDEDYKKLWEAFDENENF